jgi:hypothetical protein
MNLGLVAALLPDTNSKCNILTQHHKSALRNATPPLRQEGGHAPGDWLKRSVLPSTPGWAFPHSTGRSCNLRRAPIKVHDEMAHTWMGAYAIGVSNNPCNRIFRDVRSSCDTSARKGDMVHSQSWFWASMESIYSILEQDIRTGRSHQSVSSPIHPPYLAHLGSRKGLITIIRLTSFSSTILEQLSLSEYYGGWMS